MNTNEVSVMFVAGDPSGDQHAAAVIRRLRDMLPQVRTLGIGGPSMKEEGFDQLMPFEPFNRMGFAEIVAHAALFSQRDRLRDKDLSSEADRVEKKGQVARRSPQSPSG